VNHRSNISVTDKREMLPSGICQCRLTQADWVEQGLCRQEYAVHDVLVRASHGRECDPDAACAPTACSSRQSSAEWSQSSLWHCQRPSHCCKHTISHSSTTIYSEIQHMHKQNHMENTTVRNTAIYLIKTALFSLQIAENCGRVWFRFSNSRTEPSVIQRSTWMLCRHVRIPYFNYHTQA